MRRCDRRCPPERIQVVGSLLAMRYLYDPVGNIRMITDTGNCGQVQSFTHDALDRLLSTGTTAAGSGHHSQTCGYNASGNITYTQQWVAEIRLAAVGMPQSENPGA
jgi:hypothetical protein